MHVDFKTYLADRPRKYDQRKCPASHIYTNNASAHMSERVVGSACGVDPVHRPTFGCGVRKYDFDVRTLQYASALD